jgi:uncharacterized membrane protein YqjE
MAPGQRPDDGVGDLVARLVEDGKAFARAEVNLAKAIAQHRAEKAKSGGILLGAGIALLLAGFIGLIVGIVMGLAPLIGPVLAGVAVLVVTGILGFLLIRSGTRKLAVLGSGSEEEREALNDGMREAA